MCCILHTYWRVFLKFIQTFLLNNPILLKVFHIHGIFFWKYNTNWLIKIKSIDISTLINGRCCLVFSVSVSSSSLASKGAASIGSEQDVVQASQSSTGADHGTIGGITCKICGASGLKDMYNLERHILRMHSSSFSCKICRVEFTDRHSYTVHSTYCYYYCPIDGCSFKEKRKYRLDGHVRRHSRM